MGRRQLRGASGSTRAISSRSGAPSGAFEKRGRRGACNFVSSAFPTRSRRRNEEGRKEARAAESVQKFIDGKLSLRSPLSCLVLLSFCASFSFVSCPFDFLLRSLLLALALFPSTESDYGDGKPRKKKRVKSQSKNRAMMLSYAARLPNSHHLFLPSSLSLSLSSAQPKQSLPPGRRARQPEAVPQRSHGQDGHRQAQVGHGVQR